MDPRILDSDQAPHTLKRISLEEIVQLYEFFVVHPSTKNFRCVISAVRAKREPGARAIQIGVPYRARQEPTELRMPVARHGWALPRPRRIRPVFERGYRVDPVLGPSVNEVAHLPDDLEHSGDRATIGGFDQSLIEHVGETE